MNEFAVRAPSTQSEWDAYFSLRWRVLRAPWNQPIGSERDDLELVAIHVAVWNSSGDPVAVGRLHLNSPSEAQVRYMAVEPSCARTGLGSQVLSLLETRAAEIGVSDVVLNAREEAIPFYAAHDYAVIRSAETLFGSIRHVVMRKRLERSI